MHVLHFILLPAPLVDDFLPQSDGTALPSSVESLLVAVSAVVPKDKLDFGGAGVSSSDSLIFSVAWTFAGGEEVWSEGIF